MIDKIIVNRKSDPAVAALNVAAKMGLETGGWTSADEPEFARDYGLDPVAQDHPSTALEQSVAASQGTLYFKESEETGVSLQFETLKRCTLRLNRPFLVVRLDEESGFWAARTIAGWIAENEIRVLHVDGDWGEQKQDAARKRIADIMEAACFLAMANPGLASSLKPGADPDQISRPALQVETLQFALDQLETGLSLKDKATIANMAFQELDALDATLGDYIIGHFDLFSEDSQLLADCRRRSGTGGLSPDDAAAFIIEKLWERLRATCRIRVLK